MLQVLVVQLLDLLAVLLRVEDALQVLEQFLLGLHHDFEVCDIL
jgi:hypothetical protein